MDNRTAKERRVHAVFESIAGHYDLMNDILSFRRHKAWRRFAMEKLDIREGESAIDLCCGTCDWTISLARASVTGRIVGLDFSENMLRIGREKVEREGLSGQIELVNGNAMDLPFPDNSFDHATIGFGLRNVPDYVRVLREMRRVVRPGGKVVCLELSKPEWQPFKSVYYFYFRNILPLIADWVARKYEQYKWLPESLDEFPGLGELEALFVEAGLKDVRAWPLTGGIAALHIGVKGSE